MSSVSSQSEINSIIALFSSSQFQEAIDLIVILTKSFPEDSLLHNIAGACYAGLGELGSAVNSYKKAIEIKPDYAKAHFNLGGAYHELRQFDDSVKSYKNSLAIDPNYAEAHNNLGNVLREAGELDEAINSYEKAINLNPEYVEALYSISLVFQELGQWDIMIEKLRQVAQLNDPTSLDSYSFIPVHAWSHSYADVLAVVNALASDQFEIVLPSEMLRRIETLVQKGVVDLD